MSEWKVVEIRERVDQFGRLHRILQDSAGWVLEIFRGDTDELCQHSFRLDCLTRALNASDAREAELAAEKAANAAEAATWPRKGTKTIRRLPWTPNETITVELNRYQPKFGEQRVGVYLNGEFIGATLQDLHGQKEPWKHLLPSETREDGHRRYRARYTTQAEAIRKLVTEHERTNR